MNGVGSQFWERIMSLVECTTPWSAGRLSSSKWKRDAVRRRRVAVHCAGLAHLIGEANASVNYCPKYPQQYQYSETEVHRVVVYVT